MRSFHDRETDRISRDRVAARPTYAPARSLAETCTTSLPPKPLSLVTIHFTANCHCTNLRPSGVCWQITMKAIFAVPATLLLAYRAHSRKSLTPAGIFAAVLTAIAHAIHPWNLPFVLLIVFFLAGTRVTHVCFSSLFKPYKPYLIFPPRQGHFRLTYHPL